MKGPFENVKKNLGFGMMRLPLIMGKVNKRQTCRMVDAFMQAGFNYFDTAHGYLLGQSERAVRDCLVKRYPRESYVLADKLSAPYFKSSEDIYKFFDKQLKICGVEYFDFYLMHAQGAINYDQYTRCRAYEIAQELKAQGKIKHVGLSFHDSAEFLDKILTEHPEVEFVQLQLNYLDYYDSGIQSKRCLDVCVKHNKPVIVMEPVKGGSLVKLPEEAQKVFGGLDGGSAASYAIRFAASCENVFMVLSGMSRLEQMKDNIATMSDFNPLQEGEYKAIDEVCSILRGKHNIQCTGCRYCVEGCPKGILIPDLFADMNARKMYHNWNSRYYYKEIHTHKHGKASDCIKCGKCEQVCPQHLPIRELLKKVANTFE